MFVTNKLAHIRRFFLFTIFGLVSLGQLERIELTPSRAFYIHELLLAAFVGIVAFTVRFKWREIPKSWILLTSWILLSLLIPLLHGSVPISAFLYFVRFILYLAYGFSLVQLIRQKQLHSSFIETCWILSITLIAILGWLQYFFIPDTRLLMYLGWDDHYLRLISTLFDPGFTGAILALGSIVTLHKLISGKISSPWRFGLLQWSFILTTGALLFTYSRASYLAFLVGIGILWLRSKRAGLLLAAALFLFAILLLPRGRSEGVRLERTASISARVESITSSRPTKWSELVFGSGWYSSKSDVTRVEEGNLIPSHNSAPDNSFIFVLSSLGIVGLVLYIWFLKSLGDMGRWTPVTIAVLASVSVHALFSNTLFYPFILFYLMGIIAVEHRFTANT